jgi:cobalt-zinc-cadmium efflux system membrane fusion protein
VASSVDPTTRRLAIRATIPNDDVALKPEMFANVTVFTSDEQPSVAVPRDAILYEGNVARVWTVNPDGGIVARDVTVGLVNGNMAQILSGITVGEKLVARGSLFIDRVALARQ